MSRQSNDHYDKDGYLIQGFDYGFQVWVKGYKVQNCGHPDRMRPGCCNGDKLKGQDIRNIVNQAKFAYVKRSTA